MKAKNFCSSLKDCHVKAERKNILPPLPDAAWFMLAAIFASFNGTLDVPVPKWVNFHPSNLTYHVVHTNTWVNKQTYLSNTMATLMIRSLRRLTIQIGFHFFFSDVHFSRSLTCVWSRTESVSLQSIHAQSANLNFRFCSFFFSWKPTRGNWSAKISLFRVFIFHEITALIFLLQVKLP